MAEDEFEVVVDISVVLELQKAAEYAIESGQMTPEEAEKTLKQFVFCHVKPKLSE